MLTNYEVKLKLLSDRMRFFDLFRQSVTRPIVEERSPGLVREQLRSGKNYEGDIIQSGYSAWWGAERLKVGKQVDFVDLNFTGNFYDEIFTEEVEKDEYRFGSDVEYAPDLVSRYPAILGLSEFSLAVLRDFLLQGMREKTLPYLKS